MIDGPLLAEAITRLPCLLLSRSSSYQVRYARSADAPGNTESSLVKILQTRRLRPTIRRHRCRMISRRFAHHAGHLRFVPRLLRWPAK